MRLNPLKRTLLFCVLISLSGTGSFGVTGSAQDAAAPAANTAPFPPLTPAAQQQLEQVLSAWEANSRGTKTLECRFQRWHYDIFAAPANIHASKADGVIRYAAPDKGYFKVDVEQSFDGMVDGKPTYSAKPDLFGEHWVCNGTELIEFDHGAKECKVRQLPPEMQGQQIFESPLPFVFNLDAKEIQNRFWVRMVQAPQPGLILIEAYPKRQDDRAQYRLVQIALSEKTLLPEALLMYAPNFNVTTAPKWDHYQFSDIKRNSLTQRFSDFLKGFIDEKPPANYRVIRDAYRPEPDAEIAQRPDAIPLR